MEKQVLTEGNQKTNMKPYKDSGRPTKPPPKILTILASLMILCCSFATDLPIDFVDGNPLTAAELNALKSTRSGALKPINPTSNNYDDNVQSLGGLTNRWRDINVLSVNAIGVENLPLAYFGNSATDYVVTAGTSVTLSGEAWYRNLTIQAGATLNVTPLSSGGTGYYTIRVNGTFTLSGNINGVGNGQAGSSGGASVGGLVAGNPGAALTVYTIGAIGGTGGSGGSRGGGATSGAGGALSYYYDQNLARTLAGVAGVVGNNAGNVGNAGVVVAYGLEKRLVKDGYPTYGSGGTGGGSGTGDSGGTGVSGGNGGNGGANVNIIAKTLISSASATINCSGTAGSAGGATASSIDGSGGGGGGGAGGFVSLRYKTLTGALPTINVAGGAAGAAGSVAAGGQVGGAGGAGVTGNYEAYQL